MNRCIFCFENREVVFKCEGLFGHIVFVKSCVTRNEGEMPKEEKRGH